MLNSGTHMLHGKKKLPQTGENGRKSYLFLFPAEYQIMTEVTCRCNLAGKRSVEIRVGRRYPSPKYGVSILAILVFFSRDECGFFFWGKGVP